MMQHLGIFETTKICDSRRRCDIFNGSKFLITMYHCIKLITVEHVTICRTKNLGKLIKRKIKIYSCRIQDVKNILIYIYFDNTVDDLLPNVVLRTSGSKYHVVDI